MKFISIEHDLLVTEQNEGLLIVQNNKTFLVRKWKLTQEVRDIIELSLSKGSISEINLYSYIYKTENLKLQLVQGKQFGFMTKI